MPSLSVAHIASFLSLLVSLVGSTTHAQSAVSDFLHGERAPSDEVRLRLVGDDPSLELRTDEGTYSAGTFSFTHSNGHGGYTTQSAPVRRRAYERIGFVGEWVTLRRGTNALTVFPQVVPSPAYEPSSYRATPDRARIDVVHADGRVVRATHRIRR